MKKNLFVLIIILILSFAVSSLAEPFRFRNGISFGMTIEEIIPIEEQNGVIIEEKEGKDYYFASNCKVAGYDNCEILYFFNNDNKLEQVVYIWSSHRSGGKNCEISINELNSLISIWEKDYSNMFKSLVSSLENKYEKTGYIKNGKLVFLDFNTKYDSLHIYNNPNSMMGQKKGGELLGFSQFLTNDNDNFVSIDVGSIRCISSSIMGDNKYADYDLRISYCSETKEIVEEQINKINRINDEL